MFACSSVAGFPAMAQGEIQSDKMSVQQMAICLKQIFIMPTFLSKAAVWSALDWDRGFMIIRTAAFLTLKGDAYASHAMPTHLFAR
jgi:hypothetical protein